MFSLFTLMRSISLDIWKWVFNVHVRYRCRSLAAYITWQRQLAYVNCLKWSDLAGKVFVKIYSVHNINTSVNWQKATWWNCMLFPSPCRFYHLMSHACNLHDLWLANMKHIKNIFVVVMNCIIVHQQRWSAWPWSTVRHIPWDSNSWGPPLLNDNLENQHPRYLL